MATNPNTFNQHPRNVPLTDGNGNLSDPWDKWFQQLWLRVGGANSAPISNIINTPASNLISGLAPSTITAMYTSPAALKTIINSVSVENLDVVAHTVSVYLVPSGGSPNSGNIAINALSIAPGQQLVLSALQYQVLNFGGSIQVVADVPSVVQITSSGWLTQ